MTDMYRPDWEAEDRVDTQRRYNVTMVDGQKLVLTGDLASIVTTANARDRVFVEALGGTWINVAHIVTIAPVG